MNYLTVSFTEIFQQISDGNLEMDPQIVMSVVKRLYAINHGIYSFAISIVHKLHLVLSPLC